MVLGWVVEAVTEMVLILAFLLLLVLLTQVAAAVAAVAEMPQLEISVRPVAQEL